MHKLAQKSSYLNHLYKTFTNLYDEINKYPDGTVFDTNDPIRKKLNKSLQQYGKDNIKSSKKKSALLKHLDQVKPEIEEINAKRIKEND